MIGVLVIGRAKDYRFAPCAWLAEAIQFNFGISA